MSDLTLTKIRFSNGVWEGKLSNTPDTGGRPDIQVRLLDQLIDDVTLKEGNNDTEWDLLITVPNHAVADGVHSFVIYDAKADTW